MNRLKGNIVFGGNVHEALLLEYKSNCMDADELFEECLIYAEQLTNEVALDAIKYNVAGIITNTSSFATHGANILRTYFKVSDNHFLWMTNIRRNELEQYIGKRVSIFNGEFYLEDCSSHDDCKQHVEFLPINNRTIIAYNAFRKELSLCYWPHREYDLFTFSIMKRGLEKNYEFLFQKKSNVFLDESGHIWFENGIPLGKIIDMARDCKVSEWFLQKQIDNYNQIIEEVNERITLKKCIDLLIKYFSVFLLYHNTYEFVLLDIYKHLEKDFGAEFAVSGMNEFLYCYIDEWMLNQSLALEKHKSLYANEPLTPVPDFSIYDDIKKKEREIRLFFAQCQQENYYERNKKIINYWLKVFVVKEWKFVVNKILFTRCGKEIRAYCVDNIPLNKLKNMKVETLFKLMGDV